jgi:hypothetical protein
MKTHHLFLSMLMAILGCAALALAAGTVQTNLPFALIAGALGGGCGCLALHFGNKDLDV